MIRSARALLAIAAALMTSACGAPPVDPPAPAITVDGVAPGHGRLPGGTTIVIDGTGFVPGPGGAPPVVVIGERKATAVTIVDAYTLTATTPAGDQAGDVDVLVAQPGGFARLDRGYAYDPPPQVTAITPARGDAGGGTAITIDGAGFQANDAGAPIVQVGDATATDVTVVSDTRITATTPPGSGFTHAAVTVRNARGESPAADFFYTGRGLIVAGGLNGVANNLYYVDPASGLTSYMFTINDNPTGIYGLSSLAMDADGTLWGTAAGSYPQLIHIDVEHATTDNRGDIATLSNQQVVQVYCDDLEAVAGALYCTWSGQLYRIDRDSAQATAIGDLAARPFEIARVGDAVYALRGCCATNQLAPLDLTTGALGTPIDLSMGGAPLQDSTGNAAGFDGSVVFIGVSFWGPDGAPGTPPSSVFGSQILRTDVATGVTTLLTNLPIQTYALTAVE